MALADDLAVVDGPPPRRTCIDKMLDGLGDRDRQAALDALLGTAHTHAELARKFQNNGLLTDLEAHQAVQRWRSKHRVAR